VEKSNYKLLIVVNHVAHLVFIKDGNVFCSVLLSLCDQSGRLLLSLCDQWRGRLLLISLCD